MIAVTTVTSTFRYSRAPMPQERPLRRPVHLFAALLALAFAAPAVRADRQQDPELGRLLEQAIAADACFEDQYDQQVWFASMEPQLKKLVPDARERADILHNVHCEARRLNLPPG